VLNGIASVMVVGALLIAGTALAQTAGTSVGPDIVPLTGPSPAAGVPILPSPASVAATVPAEPAKSKGIRSDPTIAKPATVTPSARKTVKVAHKPGTKAAVKKASAPKRMPKATGRPAKPKQVATAKRPPPARQATVSAPIPLTKPAPSGKNPAPPKAVLPRV
jgi:hypothetical protein